MNDVTVEHLPESTPTAGAGSGRQRILVLGASGFIGRRVVERLAAGDWAIPVAASHRTVLDSAVISETLQFDARQSDEMQNAVKGVAGIVNCITGDSKTIIASAQALFAACSRLSAAPRIVHLSTMMVYGSVTGTVDETSPFNGDWSAYSAAKIEVERMSRACKSVVCLRPGIVYGPGSPIWTGRIGRWLQERRLGALGAAGAGYCNLVHVDDVVEAVHRALRTPGIDGEAFNLSLSSPPTWNEYFRQFGAALGLPEVAISHSRLMLEQHVFALPLKLAEILSPMMPFDWRPLEPIRPWLLRLCRHPIRLNVHKSERLLGIAWTPLDKGLRESAAWVLARAEAKTP